VDTLARRLGLDRYRRPAPLREETSEVAKVTLPLVQGVGAPARPVVRLGQKVRKGELVAECAAGSISSCVHASISGTVTAVSTESISIAR